MSRTPFISAYQLYRAGFYRRGLLGGDLARLGLSMGLAFAAASIPAVSDAILAWMSASPIPSETIANTAPVIPARPGFGFRVLLSI